MTLEKRDQLRVCNDQGVPLEDFRLQFCDRCLARDCTRSQAGKSKFEQRTSTWKERLFDEVPRLSPDDPRIEVIQAKRFRESSPKAPHEVKSSWDDPRDLTESSADDPQVVPVPDAADFSKLAAEHIRQNLEEEQAARLSTPVQQVEPEAPADETPRTPAPQFVNTPNQPGQMLGGKKVDKQAASPVLDPWEPKKTTTDDVEVVQPGARVRMGGSGV